VINHKLKLVNICRKIPVTLWRLDELHGSLNGHWQQGGSRLFAVRRVCLGKSAWRQHTVLQNTVCPVIQLSSEKVYTPTGTQYMPTRCRLKLHAEQCSTAAGDFSPSLGIVNRLWGVLQDGLLNAYLPQVNNVVGGVLPCGCSDGRSRSGAERFRRPCQVSAFCPS
jgi:hypothetical protein